MKSKKVIYLELDENLYNAVVLKSKQMNKPMSKLLRPLIKSFVKSDELQNIERQVRDLALSIYEEAISERNNIKTPDWL